MTALEKRLADALRPVLRDTLGGAVCSEAEVDEAVAALAAFDAMGEKGTSALFSSKPWNVKDAALTMLAALSECDALSRFDGAMHYLQQAHDAGCTTDIPWRRGILACWTITGMNHYHAGGTRRLYVSMERFGRAIRAEGPDGPDVWAELERLATEDDATATRAAKIETLLRRVARERQKPVSEWSDQDQAIADARALLKQIDGGRGATP